MKEALDNPACRGVISFGIAGGLDARLRTGTHLVASQVITPEGPVSTHEAWSRALLNSSAEAVHATFLGMDYVILEPVKSMKFSRRPERSRSIRNRTLRRLWRGNETCRSPACEL